MHCDSANDALGHPDVLDRVRGVRRDGERGGVRAADVLGGEDHHPPREEPRVLAALEHDREVVERRVGVGRARRLDPRGDVVVVLVAALVVAQRAALQRLLGDLHRHVVGGVQRDLQRAQRGARVAAGAVGEERDRLVVDGPRALFPVQGAAEQGLDVGGVQRVQLVDPHPREEAELTSKYGFSVVAPMSVTRPSSTAGSSASCCALLKRWISSRKNVVAVARGLTTVLRALEHRADLRAARLDGAELLEGRAGGRAATRASVVFPLPGGP